MDRATKALPLLESRSGAVKTLPAPASARGSGAMVATKPNRLAHGTARESRRVRWWRLSRRGLRRAAKVSVGAIAGAIACAVVAVGAADGASLVGAHLGPTTGAWNLGTSMVAVAVTEQFLTQRLCGRHVPPLRAQTADAIAALDEPRRLGVGLEETGVDRSRVAAVAVDEEDASKSVAGQGQDHVPHHRHQGRRPERD